MAVPIPDAPPAADKATAAAPAAAPASATPAAVTTPPSVSAPSGSSGGTDPKGSESAAERADADDLSTLTDLTEAERQTFGKAINALSPDDQKLFKKLLTTKTQGIADVRKTVQAKADLLKSLEDDPIGTATKILEDAKAAGATPGQPLSPSNTAAMAAGEASAASAAVLKKHLGPELEFLADPLAPAVGELVKGEIDKVLGPLAKKAEADAEAARVAAAQSEAVAFAKTYPDWEKHSARMTELAQSVHFADNVSPGEQLAHLYKIASAEAVTGEKTQDVLDKIAASAAVAGSSAPAQGVPASRVVETLPKKLTWAEAAAAARRERAAASA